MSNNVTYEYTNQNITIDGSIVANDMSKFFDAWEKEPMKFHELIKVLYMDAVMVGMRHAGLSVNGYKEKDKAKEF